MANDSKDVSFSNFNRYENLWDLYACPFEA